MMGNLASWEAEFKEMLLNVGRPARQQAGALLSAIPLREKWSEFLEAAQDEWWWWQNRLEQHPCCLLVLYGGVAFYEYDDNTLWPQFAKSIGLENIPTNQQTQINKSFASVAVSLGLKIQEHNYVGSAIYHIGIPLSLWDGFIELCEWALVQDGWETLSDADWGEVVAKVAGGRTRLAIFLRDNREAATQLVREMLSARRRFAEDPGVVISDLHQASLLRREYLEDVPETAEFLCPQNPEKLLVDPIFTDRAQLSWDDARSRIVLRLPAVSANRLPAAWSVGERMQTAATTPDEWALNGLAFEDVISLKLQSGVVVKKQRLRGIRPWGLFDLEKGALVNLERQQLPLRPYLLVSTQKIDKIKRQGFDEEENPANELWALEDGTQCFITRLYPTGKSASLAITCGATTKRIQFRASSKIEARVFIGEGQSAAKFSRYDDLLRVERLPLPCVAIPVGYFKDAEWILRSKFKVIVDEMPAYGQWQKRHADENREFYVWSWADRPVTRGLRSGTFRSFDALAPLKEDLKPVDLTGKRTLSIISTELGIRFDYKLEVLKPHGADKFWQNLPGAYALWFLLVQGSEGMKWDDLLLAKEIIAPDAPFSYTQLRRYSGYGLLRQHGQAWKIAESRAVIERGGGGDCTIRYCGDPSVLWGLYRRIYSGPEDANPPERKVWKVGSVSIPLAVEVVQEKRSLPFVLLRTKEEYWAKVKDYLENRKVRIVSNLWSC